MGGWSDESKGLLGAVRAGSAHVAVSLLYFARKAVICIVKRRGTVYSLMAGRN